MNVMKECKILKICNFSKISKTFYSPVSGAQIVVSYSIQPFGPILFSSSSSYPSAIAFVICRCHCGKVLFSTELSITVSTTYSIHYISLVLELWMWSSKCI